jgi:hypothetical protein
VSTFSESAGAGPDGQNQQYSPGVPAPAEQRDGGAVGSGDRRSPTAELTALAAHLRRISDRVEQVATAHTELAALVSERLAPEITALRNDTVEQLSAQAAQIHQILTATEAVHHPPIDWPGMTAEQAATAWGDLAHWIADVLVPWYQITREELPDCWAMHRPAVVELSWLRSAHIEAFAPNTAAHHAADWHTRWRPAALARLREVIPRHGARSCSPGEHLVPDHERVRRHPAPPPPPPALTDRQPLPGEQLAERHHWETFLEQAVTTDRAWRLDRETRIWPGNPA